ncbi:meckelin [Cephus cinctus]|uniref:Meckelin n=1 Tax=Cephus cinctus TaxID=211228 RepID=A0AAJ7C2S7_CEPCN|nr:meckelin [Cephus cinctus]
MFNRYNCFSILICYSCLIMSYISGLNTNDIIFEFSDPTMCDCSNYYDLNTFSCIQCDAKKNLIPSYDRLICICNKTAKTIGYKKGIPLCHPCDQDEVVTSDGLDCISCQNIRSNDTCNCSPGEIKLERNASGILLPAFECLPCPENFYPSSDGLKCLPCNSNTYASHMRCACPIVSHVRIFEYCIPKNGLTSWPDVRSTYLAKFDTQSIDSYYLRTELQLAVYLCEDGNKTACEHLSNMCALTLFQDSMPCKMVLQSHNFPVQLFYGAGESANVLSSRKISQRYTLVKNNDASELKFMVAAVSLRGKFQSIETPNIVCNIFTNTRFGVNVHKKCKITAEELLNTKMEAYIPYLMYNENEKKFLHALPVFIKNINKNENNISQWQHVRRFFVFDNILGYRAIPSSINNSFQKEADLAVFRYIKSFNVLVKTQSKEERGKIYPPLIVIEYEELEKEEILNNVDIIMTYKVTYSLEDNDLDSAMGIYTGVFSGFALVLSALKTWSYCRRNGNNVPNAGIFIWFSIFSCGILGNVLLFVSFTTSIYTFIFYKGQTVLHVLLPAEVNEFNIQVFTAIAFCFKVIEMAALMYQLQNVSVFFVDWEQSKTVQAQIKHDSPHTSLKKQYSKRFSLETSNPLMSTPSGLIPSRKNKISLKSNADDVASGHSSQFSSEKSNEDFTEYSDMNITLGGRDNEQLSTISIWRTYFVANEWLRIQTRRKISMIVQSVFTLFLLEVVGLKFLASANPELMLDEQENFSKVEHSFTLRYAVGAMVYMTVYFVQWMISVTFYQRYITNFLQEFIDLCSIANISTFVLALNYYGFYIHGRSVHGFADTDLATLLDNLKMEEENLCAHRGLVPGTTDQTFVISVSTAFRAFYNKVLRPLKSDENRFLRRNISEQSSLEKSLQIHLKLKKFLIGFLDHCYKDLDYVVKEKQLMEKVGDIELTDVTERSVFYIDNKYSFDRVLFHGNECTLATFEITLFIFIEVFSESYILAMICTFSISQLVCIYFFIGCRSAPISLEARSLSGWRTSRHCVVTRALDLTLESFQSIRSKAGALIIVLPEKLDSLTEEEKQHIMSLEEFMIFGPETLIPVYFASWNAELQVILDDITTESVSDEKTGTAAEAMFNSISASGYQVVVASGQPAVRSDIKVATLQGKLTGAGAEEKLPTIALVAYYDSSGVAPELSFGVDSNASGVSLLLELARLFSALYSMGKSRPAHNLVFILTGAGKLNYQGSKKWLEDQLDGLEGSIIQDASYVICLDTITASNNLYVHVSKPPKETSPGGLFYKELKSVADSLGSINVEGVHKKINLAEETLAWEHERYSIRRLPAATLSSLKSHKDPIRTTILDVARAGQVDRLYKHTQVVAEALAKHIYNLSSSQIFAEPLSVSKDSLSLWLNYLASQPRAAPLLADKQNPLVSTLREAMSRYLGDVKVTLHSPDKRDPEFVFYDVTKATLNVYSVKPAVFDLFLTIAIVLYLGIVYLAVHNFPHVYSLATSLSVKTKTS